MRSLSIEIKARCSHPRRIRTLLLEKGASFKGVDRQTDTYFCVPSGRLKLREGNIENALIYYKRVDQKKSKRCDSVLTECGDGTQLKKTLSAALGELVVVNKRREIFFIRNVKFHIDQVQGLGSFVEIEVFGCKGDSGAKLRKQCEFYQKFLGISPKDLLRDSYSDQLLKSRSTRNA